MAINKLLNRLANAKQTGPGQWIACCPAHDDRRPSLAIRALEDGRVLIHDFGGCETSAVLDAVGLQFDDLYPQRSSGQRDAPIKRPYSPRDILTCIALEVLIVVQCANVVSRGQALASADHERLVLAASRLLAAERIAHE
jgi:hypothetical protein